jgi:hypothetical protein
METLSKWVLASLEERYTQDKASGKWIRKILPDSPEAYFESTAKGTPVVAELSPVVGCGPVTSPQAEGFEPGIYRAVFWRMALVKASDQHFICPSKGRVDVEVYRYRAILRESPTSKRDYLPGQYFSRLDDTARLEGLRLRWAEWRETCRKEDAENAAAEARYRASEVARKAAQKAAWQEAWTRKLEADRVRAAELGMDLEEYLEGLAVTRKMRLATRPGCCLICKRPLSLKTSVKRGVGPECFKSLSLAERISAAASVVAKSEEVTH